MRIGKRKLTLSNGVAVFKVSAYHDLAVPNLAFISNDL